MQHTLDTVLQDTFFFPSPPTTIFSNLCILKTLDSLPGGSCVGPLGVVCFSGDWRSSELTHFNSGLLISRTFLPHAGSSCTLLFCLYFVSCTQQMHWKVHSLADTIAPFLTILQFSSELSNNWGTGLPCLCSSRIYCTEQYKGKGKALPLQAWSGPEGSRKLRFPDFITTAQDSGKVVSLTHRPPLPPGNAPDTHFC